MKLLNRPTSSLHLRLFAGTLAWVVITLAIAGWGLSGLFRQHVTEQLYETLEIQLEQLAGSLTVNQQGKIALSDQLSDPRLRRPYGGLYWQIDQVNGSGKTSEPALLRSRSLWDTALQVPEDIPAHGELHRHRITGPKGDELVLLEQLVYPAEAPEQSLRLMVAADENLVREPVARFNGILIIVLVILGGGLTTAAVMQVVIGLRPLGKLRKSLQAVHDGKAQRIDQDYPQEIQPLVDDFNAVLGQNTRIVEQARTHAGNLAHALKTPLTILANAAARPDGNLPSLVNEQVSVALRQINHHLARARAAAAVNIPGMRAEVCPVVESLVRVMQRLHQGKAIQITVNTGGIAPVFRGEKQDLQEMLGNLLENAWKWAGSRIDITIEPDAQNFTVVIDDDGPGIPPGQRQLVLARGARADEEVPGTGLGLAIVSDLARLYNGSCSLDESPTGGLRAKLTLPVAAYENHPR